MTPGRLSARAARELSEAFEERESVLVAEDLPYRVDVDPRRHVDEDVPRAVVEQVVEDQSPLPQPQSPPFCPPPQPPPIVVEPQPALFGLPSVDVSNSPSVKCSPLSLWWQLGGPPKLAKTGSATAAKKIFSSREALMEVRAEKSKAKQANRQLMDAFESLVTSP